MTLLVTTLLLQLISGAGVLALCNVRIFRSAVIPLSILAGMMVNSVVLFAFQLFYIPIDEKSVLFSAAISAIATNVLYKRVREFVTWFFSKPRLNIKMYDVVIIGFALSIGYIVTWATWYWPVTPFDAMAGIDLVARQTVIEGTIVNRVFTDPSLTGHLSNQPFYAPHAMLMQVMYRLIGFEYGQVWLAVVSISFSWFMFTVLRHYCAPFIANILWILFLLTPELLGYTYLLQTDYVNAVYFSTAVLLLVMSFQKEDLATKWLSIVFFAGACWTRTESIALIGLGMLLVLPLQMKSDGLKKTLWYGAVVMSVCAAVFGLWHIVFFNLYLPVQPDGASEIVGLSLSRMIDVVGSTFSLVIFDKGLWGATFLLFALALVIDVLVNKKLTQIMLLVWITAVFVGLIIVGTVFTSAIVDQTLRRGVSKIVPLLFVYVASTGIFQSLSSKLTSWEYSKK